MSMNYALKSALSNFKITENELVVGGERVSELARKFGTPLYIYDSEIIRGKFFHLRKHLPSEILIFYAVKANPNFDILCETAKYCNGFDIASAGEFKRVVQAGIKPEKINFAGPGKTVQELQFVISQGIGSISIESKKELEHCIEFSSSLLKPLDVLVRVNPSFELSSSGIKMGGGSKPFGVDSECVPEVIRYIQSAASLRFAGLHIFAGSQNLSADQIVQTFERIMQYAEEVQETTQTEIPILNMGGGFGIPLYAHEHELVISSIGQSLKVMLGRYRKSLPHTEYRIELGRYIVAECGIYLASILYKKESRGQKYYILDGGMHHHLSASGNFGQSLVRRPMPVVVANRIKGAIDKVHVVGPLCTPLDTFGYIDLPEADEGDFVAVLNSGAYGLSASPVNFLSQTHASEVLV